MYGRMLSTLCVMTVVILVVACTPGNKTTTNLVAGKVAGHLVNVHVSAVPHDVVQGSLANTQDLAVFAWQEFVALNWPAENPATTGVRGRPDASKHFTDSNPGITVWQSYRHKNEQFPAHGNTDPSFDSSQAHYSYLVPIQPANSSTSLALFNNLDESSEINLCVLCANNVSACGRQKASDQYRFLYEAKMNRATYDYGNSARLTDRTDNYATLTNKRNNTMKGLAKYGGICSSPDANRIVMLPCGDNSVPGDAGEGAIEIKAAWRRLTTQEAASGRFYTAPVLYYEVVNGTYIAHNATFGLMALHIIHKTRSFPAFVFATWEQVDAYNDSNTSGLIFHNTGTMLPDIPVVRQHPIPGTVQSVTDDVHSQINNVWKYYKLINVQAQPVTGPPAPSAPSDIQSYYYLANIAVETNQTLQKFFGKLSASGTVAPATNVYEAGTSYQMGGCQGCHGAAGQDLGGDMSVLLAAAPANTRFPESYDANAQALAHSANIRFRNYYQHIPGKMK